jgi:hypothetical protein
MLLAIRTAIGREMVWSYREERGVFMDKYRVKYIS